MSEPREQILIDYLDRVLRPAERAEVEEKISTDPEWAAQWQTLKLAISGVRHSGLRDQVASAGKAWESQREKRSASVRLISRYTLRVAACVVLLAGSTLIYKFSTMSGTGMYEAYYNTYQLPTSRSASGPGSALDRAYQSSDWGAVIRLASTTGTKDSKTLFLEGIACMELKQYAQAVSRFKQVLAQNARTKDGYFNDESEYYLALSWLAENHNAEALVLLKKIKEDPDHRYHQHVIEMWGLNWKILNLKNRK
jgi:tetratricopeptide (TPR) repeat protein